MIKSKTILLLKAFSPGEIKSFGDFLNSPYFNTNARVSRLFNELKKHYPEFTSRAVEKENLYTKLFPGKVYNEQVMKNLISELLKLEKEFLAIDGFRNNSYEKSLGLVDQLKYRQAEPVFEKETEALKESLPEADITVESINLYMHLLEEKIFTHNLFANKQSVVSGNIEKSGEYLTVFFLKAILRISANDHINRFSFNQSIDKKFPDIIINSIQMEKLLGYMESVNIKEALSLKLAYYGLVSIINADDEGSYKIYHDMLYANIKNLGREDALLYFHLMESICAQRINAGKAEFYKELFDTYVHEISNNLFGPNTASITVLKFRNIFMCAIRAREYDWAEKFINDFKAKLQKENRKNIVDLALAQLNFERGSFPESLEYLNKIKTEQVYFKIDVRTLNLKLLYEMGHYESAISLIESFKRMLTKNSSLTEQYSRKNLSFISGVNSLIRLKTDFTRDSVLSLGENIKANEVISNKKWLLEKIEELKKR